MKRVAGILGMLVAICVFTTLQNGQFVDPGNLYNVFRWTALYGIISVGVAFVIITGGIDLSIGSVVALTGCLLAILLEVDYVDTGTEFAVDSADGTERTIRLDADASAVAHQDQLVYSDRRGVPRSLTVERNGDANPDAKVVRVREYFDLLEPGTKLTFRTARHMNPVLAIAIVMAIALAIGLLHGVLITKLKLQPFIVTLCGLLIYRGVTRGMAGDKNVGFYTHYETLKSFATGKPFAVPIPFIDWIAHPDQPGTAFWAWVPIPAPMLILIALALAAAVFLNRTIYGRYLLALGRNEKAAQYSGIDTDRMTTLAYVLCSGLAGLGGILFALDLNSVQPNSHGGYYELYAIAAAVLGGCSLRGGEGTILGVLLGAALIRTLRNATNILDIPTRLEFAILGGVILIGVITDELVKRAGAKRRAIRESQGHG